MTLYGGHLNTILSPREMPGRLLGAGGSGVSK